MDMPSLDRSSDITHSPAVSPAVGQPLTTPLPHLAVIEVKGPQAGTFLQGQLTQDVLSMNAGQARAGGYCSAKGRLLGNFVIVHPQEETWWLVVRSGLVEALARRLRMFVLRAKCSVAPRPDLLVQGVWSSALPPWAAASAPSSAPETVAEVQPPAIEVGWWGQRALRMENRGGVPAEMSPAPAGGSNTDASAWDHADILAGWPWVEPATVEQFVPQMINFEVLGGVNFRKGCYPGQEVVARSQYRGTLKRRMGLFAVQTEAPAPGTEVYHSEDPDQPAGLVVNAAADPQQIGWATVLVEHKIAALAGGSLHLGSIGGPVLAARVLPYAFPTEA